MSQMEHDSMQMNARGGCNMLTPQLRMHPCCRYQQDIARTGLFADLVGPCQVAGTKRAGCHVDQPSRAYATCVPDSFLHWVHVHIQAPYIAADTEIQWPDFML